MRFLLLLFFMLSAHAETPFTDYVNVNRQVNGASPIYCGWECGLRVDRNTVGKTGGNFNDTNSQFMLWNKVGKGVKNREFTGLILTESEQDSGEAVSLYLKTEKRGNAPAWAGTFELRDRWNYPGAAVGIEVDMFTAGPATDAEGDLGANGGRVRVGVDIVGGDELFKSDGVPSNAQASLGFNIYATANTPWFRWLSGGQIRDYQKNGLILVGSGSERGIRFKGHHTVGLDFTGGTFQDVMRLRAGMAIAFDEYGDWLVKRLGDEVVFQQRAQKPDGTWEHRTVMALTRGGEVKAKKFTVIP